MKNIRRTHVITIMLILITAILYNITQIDSPTPYDYFIRLGKSFLEGKIYLTEQPPHLNELVPGGENKWFVPYPPMPALIAIPFILLNYANQSQTAISLVFGAFNTGLLYLVVRRLYNSDRIAILIALLGSFGTTNWYLATEGSSWYISHVIAVFFLLLALLCTRAQIQDAKITVTKNWKLWLLGGLFLGAAYWARLPTIGALIFFVCAPYLQLIQEKSSFKNIRWDELKSQLIKNIACGVGVAVFVCANFAYNYARYGAITDESYNRIPGVLEEPWFYDGILSVKYIPNSVSVFLFKMPLQHDSFPYVKPSIEALSIFVLSPYLLFLIGAKWKQLPILLFALTSVAMLLPGLMHGGVGFTQFGYRYANEATIVFLLIFGSFLQRKYWWISVPLMIMAPLVSIWGMYFIRTLNVYGW